MQEGAIMICAVAVAVAVAFVESAVAELQYRSACANQKIYLT